jgi:hypothetical protein
MAVSSIMSICVHVATQKSAEGVFMSMIMSGVGAQGDLQLGHFLICCVLMKFYIKLY